MVIDLELKGVIAKFRIRGEVIEIKLTPNEDTMYVLSKKQSKDQNDAKNMIYKISLKDV